MPVTGVFRTYGRQRLGRCDLPVVPTLMALGCVPADDVRWLGMPGMYGAIPANRALDDRAPV